VAPDPAAATAITAFVRKAIRVARLWSRGVALKDRLPAASHFSRFLHRVLRAFSGPRTKFQAPAAALDSPRLFLGHVLIRRDW
jgi:hypothetical protein